MYAGHEIPLNAGRTMTIEIKYLKCTFLVFCHTLWKARWIELLKIFLPWYVYICLNLIHKSISDIETWEQTCQGQLELYMW